MEQNNLTSELSVIEVSGVDSQKFLQGQLTNDINELDSKSFQLSAHLNNKGRILAIFIITKIAPDTYYLLTSAEVIEQIIPRIKMFVLRSKVNIVKHDYSILFSNQVNSIVDADCQLEIVAKHFITITKTLLNNTIADNTFWKNILITYGIPMVYAKTVETFLPQHVNLDLQHGVNFKKGCYTGQEIVARTHYLGKVKRRMFKFTSNSMPQIGQKVVSPKLDNQEVGIIVDILKTNHDYCGLVSLQNDCVDSAFLDLDNKQQLLIQPLEYLDK